MSILITVIVGGLLVVQTLQWGVLYFLLNQIEKIKKIPVIRPTVHSEHIECKQCHSIVARYNPATGLCANCDSEGYLKSRNV